MAHLIHSNPLLRHDAMIIAGECAIAFSTWRDRVMLLAMVVLAAAVTRAAVGSMAGDQLVFWGAVIAAGAGAAAQAGADRRLRFFAAETPLAGQSLSLANAAVYRLVVHSLTLATLVLPAVMLAPPAGPLLIPAYASGILAAALVSGGLAPLLLRLHRLAMSFAPALSGPWLKHPLAGAAVALIASAVALLLHRYVAPPVAAAILGAVAMAAVLMLGWVDHAIVRFEALAGLPPGASIWSQERSSLTFLAVQLPLAAMVSPSAAGIAVLLGAAVLVLNGVRVCLYRVHTKSIANVILAALAGLVALLATSVPFLALPIALALAFLLWRRAAAAAWAMP